MLKKIIAIAVFLIIAIGVPAYILLKDDPDIQHYNPYDEGPTDLSIFVEALEGPDNIAEYKTRSIISSPVLLKGIKDPEQTCYVVVGVDREYRQEEIKVIEKFVREDGGKAIIMDDFGSPNALSEKFGVFFYGKPMWDDINMTGPRTVRNISFPIFNFKLGLQPHTVVLNGPTGLTTYNPNVEYIANGSEKSYVDLDGNGRINIGDKKGNIPVIIEVRFNESKGRIVFIADADIATDDMLKFNSGNKAFMIQLVNRVMDKKDGLILFDESRHEHVPSQEIVYKNVETVAIMSSWFWPTVMTIVSMVVIFGIVVYSSKDKESWIHRFDVSAFSRRYNPPERLTVQTERARSALMLKVRMMYSYSTEEMAALQPDQVRAMIKDKDLTELALNPSQSWTQQELRVVIQRIKEWGAD
ncbi:MAG: hypothetical protein GQ558_10265 [Thermoplasmata archaeon]|nr:hypothetical protein [Thermoplasmata archaeon]